MLTLILSLFGILVIASLSIKINTRRKLILLNHTLATIFFLILFFSVFNLFTANISDFNHIFHIGNIENYFLLMFSILGIAISFYNDFYFGEYLKHNKNLNFYYVLLLIFIISMLGVIVSSEAVTFLSFWEIMSISSYFLIVHEATKKDILKNGAWYLIITHIGMFFILLSFIPFIISTNSTFFINWHGAILTPALASFSFFSALIGFGSKAGLFPIHIWKPKTDPIAPNNVSALMSGFMVKLPVLMILKFLLFFFAMNVQFSWFIITLLVASISAFLGIFYSLIQNNINRMLAYSTIENIGIIFLGISISILGMILKNNELIVIGIFATLYHSFNHTIFKGLMYLLAGGIIERTKTYEYTKLGGMLKSFPLLGISFLIGVIAIAGVLPLNGFNSEFLIYIGLFKGIIIGKSVFIKLMLLLSILALASTAILSLINFTKVFGIAFLGNKRYQNIEYEDIKSLGEKISYGFLITLIFLLSIFPGFIYLLTTKILGIEGSGSIITFGNLNLNYIPIYLIFIIIIFVLISYFLYKALARKEKNIGVWNCGYNYIEPKTQYTSTSFIQPLRRIYTSFYGERRKINKKSKIDSKNTYKKNLLSIDYSINNTYYTDEFYLKILKHIGIISKSVKSLQNGEIQSYIFYMFVAIFLLFLILLFL